MRLPRVAPITALMLFAGSAAQAQSGYTLYVEDGIDAISVRELVASHMGRPGAVARIDPHATAQALRDGGAVVVASPAMLATLEDDCGRNALRNAALDAELGRVMPADRLVLAKF